VNPEWNDFKGIAKEHETIPVLCEGCGSIWVDCEGKKIVTENFYKEQK